jgi:allophanate hydrolase subunit 2
VGQVVDVGSFGQGFRTYVAVAGGFVGPEVFGSVSSDELCGLGPGGLSAGQLLHAGGWAPPLGDHIAVDATGSPAGAPIVLRVVPGPHAEWFIPDVMQVLAEAAFVVEDESNRVGLRLRAATGGLRVGVTDVALTELDSQGVVTGAIQVPPDGIPVVLLPDHATLGGYPVAAVVAWADHGLLGQCAPGATVRLVPINQEEAGHERLLRMREMEGAVAGHYPLAVD